MLVAIHLIVSKPTPEETRPDDDDEADACATQYEFIVVNGLTTTSEFYKVVLYYGKVVSKVAKTIVTYVKLFHDSACPKLLKSANFSRSYSKNKSGTVF